MLGGGLGGVSFGSVLRQYYDPTEFCAKVYKNLEICKIYSIFILKVLRVPNICSNFAAHFLKNGVPDVNQRSVCGGESGGTEN